MKPLISLDVFDTAIFRKVFNPTDIFNVVEDEVGNNFKALRIRAQESAGRKTPFYTLLDIYKELKFPFSPKEEIKAEYENCKANPQILDIYNKGEADYIFISDMYLPSIVIKSMLEKCGYENPQVFVSCELKACKGDGRLFTKVEEVLGRKIAKHIGDNYNCDIKGAQRVHIPEVEYIGPAIYNREVITPVLENVKLRKLLIDNELSDRSIEEKIGYQFAPLALAFTQSVLDEATDNQTIFFNARDSFIMYVIARWILKTKKKIKYCRFSRKSCLLIDISTNLPLKHPSNSPSLHFFKIQRAQSLRDFLKLYNLDENKDYSALYKEFAIGIDTNIEFHGKRSFILERALEINQEEFYNKVNKEKVFFSKYISNLGMKNGDIFVDLGYAGTIQGIIKRNTGINLKGRYVNTYDTEGKYMGCTFEKKSFLPVGLLRSYGGALVEVIFTEAKGTTMQYDQNGAPILLKDFKFRKGTSHKIFHGIFQGVKDLIDENIDISMEDCTTLLKRFLDFPTIGEATFGNSDIFENGTTGTESITWYNKKYIKQGKVRECYNRSYWKSAFKLLLSNDSEYKFLVKEL